MTEWLRKHWRKLAGGGLLLVGSAVAGKIAWPDAFSKALEGLAKMIMMCLILAVITAGCSSTSTTTTVKPDGTKITEKITDEKAFYDAHVAKLAKRKPVLEIEAKDGESIKLDGVKRLVVWGHPGSQGAGIPQHVSEAWKTVREWGGIAGTVVGTIGNTWLTYRGIDNIISSLGAVSGTHTNINNSFNPTGANSPPTYGNSTPTFDDHRINNSYNDNSSQMHQDGE